MINYTLNITNLGITSRYSDKPNFVAQIMLQITAVDDELGLTGLNNCMMGILVPDDSTSTSFISYEALTEEIVMSWIDEDDPRIVRGKEMAAAQIELKKQPSRIAQTDSITIPPWIPPVVYETSSSSTSSTGTNIQMWQGVVFEQNLAKALIKFGLLTEDPTTIPVSTP